MAKIDATIENNLKKIIKAYHFFPEIIKDIHQQKGRALLVGGAVRDLLVGLPVKDLDVEVHGITLQGLEDILKKYGPVSYVGKSFGVLRLHSLDIDWSLPRADTAGRKPTVTVDPFMSIDEAFSRRDLTINAIGIDLSTFELLDPFGGQEDLKTKTLRSPNTAFFIEDPLRFYRVMQFISRFEMKPDATLQELCKKMDVSTVSRERIEQEFKKLLLKSKRPSLGLRWLVEIGRLQELFPELAALQSTEQNPQWHPEGNVFEHAMQALDAAARIACDTEEEKLVLMYAALCHDLGKATTTKLVDGQLKSIGHAEAGVAIARRLLQRITNNIELIAAVCTLVRYHMEPLVFIKGNAGPAAYKRLAAKIAGHTSINMLAKLSLADRQGRNPKKGEPLTDPVPEVAAFLAAAQQAQVAHEAEQPILQGRDLLDVIKPGPLLGKLVQRAYELQIEEGICDKELLKERVLSTVKRK